MYRLLAFLLLISVAVNSAMAQIMRNTTLPNSNDYSWTYRMARDIGPDGTGYYDLYWRLETQDDHDVLRFAVILTGWPTSGNRAMDKAWLGLGFGDSMLRADFLVLHQEEKEDGVHAHEHIARKVYAPPYKDKNSTWITKAVNGGGFNGTMFVEWVRPLLPPANDTTGHHASLSRGGSDSLMQSMIWAYQPRPNLNIDNSYFTYHDHNPGAATGMPTVANQTHGAFRIDFLRGRVAPVPISSYERKIAHGTGMLTAWLIILPSGIFYARYLRSKPGWIWVHLSTQTLGYLTILSFLIVILTTVKWWPIPHAIIGITLFTFVTIQLALGLWNRYMVAAYLPSSYRRAIRIMHRTLGMSLIGLAIAQVAIGASILFPKYEPRGQWFWYLYFAVLAFWILAFIIAEAWKFISQFGDKSVPVSTDPYQMQSMPVESGKKGVATVAVGQAELMRVQNATMQKVRDDSQLKEYTWDALDAEVKNGKILVVGNGRFVYDASTWIHSHPGGQVILLAVAGTDISSDYFHEAGYDAADFTPAPKPPPQPLERLPATHFRRDSTVTASSVSTEVDPTRHRFSMTRATPILTNEDWSRIIRARRTHVHSRNAIARLAHLLVGEVVPDQGQMYGGSSATLMPYSIKENAPLTGSVQKFSPFEFRRYALTSKTLVTTLSANPVYKYRFCLLYPYEGREGEPEQFQPGQCIEIQCRISGAFVSRFYSPVEGNLAAFEILVKTYPNGALTPFLTKQRPGERQFKIRGPFGQALVGPERPLGSIPLKNGVPDFLIAVSGGTGITPFLQLVQHMFLPTMVPLKVVADFDPTLNDEMALRRGQLVMAKHHYYDGWVYGTNLNTGQEGMFPLPQTLPRYGHKKVFLINCQRTPEDRIGLHILTGALLSYPHHFRVVHLCTQRNTKPVPEDLSAGEIEYGRVTEAHVQHAISTFGYSQIDEEDEDEQGDFGVGTGRRGSRIPGRWAVSCGPPPFNGLLMDIFLYRIGFDQREVAALTSYSPNWFRSHNV